MKVTCLNSMFPTKEWNGIVLPPDIVILGVISIYCKQEQVCKQRLKWISGAVVTNDVIDND